MMGLNRDGVLTNPQLLVLQLVFVLMQKASVLFLCQPVFSAVTVPLCLQEVTAGSNADVLLWRQTEYKGDVGLV